MTTYCVREGKVQNHRQRRLWRIAIEEMRIAMAAVPLNRAVAVGSGRGLWRGIATSDYHLAGSRIRVPHSLLSSIMAPRRSMRRFITKTTPWLQALQVAG